MTSPITAEVIAAAQAADYAGRDPHGSWHRIPDSQAARLIEGALPLLGLTAERTDQQIIDHPDFERAVLRMMRTNSPAFEAWARKQDRINGRTSRPIR